MNETSAGGRLSNNNTLIIIYNDSSDHTNGGNGNWFTEKECVAAAQACFINGELLFRLICLSLFSAWLVIEFTRSRIMFPNSPFARLFSEVFVFYFLSNLLYAGYYCAMLIGGNSPDAKIIDTAMFIAFLCANIFVVAIHVNIVTHWMSVLQVSDRFLFFGKRYARQIITLSLVAAIILCVSVLGACGQVREALAFVDVSIILLSFIYICFALYTLSRLCRRHVPTTTQSYFVSKVMLGMACGVIYTVNGSMMVMNTIHSNTEDPSQIVMARWFSATVFYLLYIGPETLLLIALTSFVWPFTAHLQILTDEAAGAAAAGAGDTSSVQPASGDASFRVPLNGRPTDVLLSPSSAATGMNGGGGTAKADPNGADGTETMGLCCTAFHCVCCNSSNNNNNSIATAACAAGSCACGCHSNESSGIPRTHIQTPSDNVNLANSPLAQALLMATRPPVFARTLSTDHMHISPHEFDLTVRGRQASLVSTVTSASHQSEHSGNGGPMVGTPIAHNAAAAAAAGVSGGSDAEHQQTQHHTPYAASVLAMMGAEAPSPPPVAYRHASIILYT